MKSGKGKITIAVLIVGLTVLSALLSLLLSRSGICVSNYELTSVKLCSGLRIVHLSDIHNASFGRDNSRLIKKTASQQPDIILITGDIVNGDEERTDTAERLIGELCEIAPVFISYGNHDAEHESNFGSDLKKVFEASGAVVLDGEWKDVEINGQPLRIGGIYGYCLPEDVMEARENETGFLKEFTDTARYKLLLCHMPVSWIEYGSLDSWDVDLVLCGHAHGGQVRLPFAGGVWAPDQGRFPGRECGLYRSADGERVMELSRGLGSTGRVPRFNNIPEIAVIDLLPAR